MLKQDLTQPESFPDRWASEWGQDESGLWMAVHHDNKSSEADRHVLRWVEYEYALIDSIKNRVNNWLGARPIINHVSNGDAKRRLEEVNNAVPRLDWKLPKKEDLEVIPFLYEGNQILQETMMFLLKENSDNEYGKALEQLIEALNAAVNDTKQDAKDKMKSVLDLRYRLSELIVDNEGYEGRGDEEMISTFRAFRDR